MLGTFQHIICRAINKQNRRITLVLSYVLNRLLQFIPTVFGVVTLTFFFIHLVPGDPIEAMLGEDALMADRVALEQKLGLDKPIGTQFKDYLLRLSDGDLGTSIYSGEPVVDLISARLPATVELAVTALLFAIILAFPLGVWAARNRGKLPDRIAMTGSLVGFSMPNFWLGPLLIIFFSLWLGWLPVSGREDGWLSLILPAVTLGTGMAAVLSRLVRSSLLEVMNADFIRTAQAKGVSERAIVWKHAMSNALLPVITVLFLQAGALLTGAILTEAVFSWPGLGTLMIEALNQRDYMVVQGNVLLIASVYLTMTLLADLLYAWADPRVRWAGAGNE